MTQAACSESPPYPVDSPVGGDFQGAISERAAFRHGGQLTNSLRQSATQLNLCAHPDYDLSVLILCEESADHALVLQCLRKCFEWRGKCVGCPIPVRVKCVRIFADHDPCGLPHKSSACAKIKRDFMTRFDFCAMNAKPFRHGHRILRLPWILQFHFSWSTICVLSSFSSVRTSAT